MWPTEMDPEGDVIWVYSIGDEGVMAFTDSANWKSADHQSPGLKRFRRSAPLWDQQKVADHWRQADIS